ncbi:MAG: NUDIX pyrophosphatase [Bacteroidetes bacterium]|nr:NUDIX pyrophosphatase [Bacteroidota bacterium]
MKLQNIYIQAYLYRRREMGPTEYLLLQRARAETLYPGMWQMITGRIESGEGAVEAARREIYEETGMQPDAIFVVPYVAAFYFAQDDSIHHVPVFAATVPSDAEVLLSTEHDAYAWLEYEEAWKRLVFPGHREGLRMLRDYVIENDRPMESL